MIDAIGSSLSALHAQERRIDALANDVANVSTNGYRAQAGGSSRRGAQGAIVETGRPLDLAIEGDAWFQVTARDGRAALTRSGSFGVDGSGHIVTASGERLNAPVQLPAGTSSTALSVAADGTVSVDGMRVGRIPVVSVAAPDALEPIGGGLYAPTAASGAPLPTTSATVHQGALESSNVDLADTAVGQIDARTSYAAAVAALHVQDEMWGALLELRR
jgi:flagellar basal body rod protein FlgG